MWARQAVRFEEHLASGYLRFDKTLSRMIVIFSDLTYVSNVSTAFISVCPNLQVINQYQIGDSRILRCNASDIARDSPGLLIDERLNVAVCGRVGMSYLDV